MFRRMALTSFLILSCIWCLALVTSADSVEPASPTGAFKPVASVESLMHGQGIFFKEITKYLKEPAGKHRNEEIVESAEVLAELANVNRYNHDKEDYRAWATQLRDQALQLASQAKAAGSHEDARMKEQYKKIKATCTACHDVYQ